MIGSPDASLNAEVGMRTRGRILVALFLAVSFGASPARPAAAQQTYTFTLIKGVGAALLWPNGIGWPNENEAREGLLGRILTTGNGIPETNPTDQTTCALPPSYPCAAGSPPAFLLTSGYAEGPSGAGGGDECNRETVACESAAIPSPGHGGHPGGDGVGAYSFLAIHSAPLCSDAYYSRNIVFLSGQYSYVQDPYVCNTCPPAGHGKKDGTSPSTLPGNGPAAVIQPLDVSLWATQMVLPYFGGAFKSGHMRFTLQQPGPGEVSYCGNGVFYQDLVWDFCEDGLEPGTGDLVIHQKVRMDTYSLSYDRQHVGERSCEGPDCYVENVILPTAFTQDSNTLNVQVLRTYTVIDGLSDPCLLEYSNIEGLIYAYTTQPIDTDGDGTEDRVDPCPNDPADGCVYNLLTSSACPTGQIFCADLSGAPGCYAPELCDTRRDAHADCQVDTNDVISVTGTLFFNTGLPIGPFEP
jgi:hypothetical protein